MITFIYNGVDFSSLVTTHEITGRGTLASDISTVEIAGRDGVYAYNRRRRERIVTIKLSMSTYNPTALRSLVDVFNSLVDLDEPAPLVFSDEPDMTYYAILTAEPDWMEDRSFAIGTLTFMCVRTLTNTDL